MWIGSICHKCLEKYYIKDKGTMKVKMNMKVNIKKSNSCNLMFVLLEYSGKIMINNNNN